MLDTIQAHNSQHPLRLKKHYHYNHYIIHVHHNKTLQMLKNPSEPTSHRRRKNYPNK
jgi:hypothetical protein